jgi:hypothetical protein
MPDTATDTVKVWHRRLRDTALWMRDSGLGMFGVALLVLVAGAGWGGSTLGLRDFAATRMGYEGWAAWLVPATFDGASVGLSIAAFRAAIHGRGAPLTRVGVVAFTTLSSWMNYEHVSDTSGRRVAALLPIAGVVLLESLLSEARQAFERRHGSEERPRIHPLRFVFDWVGTWRIIRAWVIGVPLPPDVARYAATAQVATGTPLPLTGADTSGDTATSGVTGGNTVTPLRRPERSGGATGDKTAIMRAMFDRYAVEGRVVELTGAALAGAAGAHPSLGRRYLREWRDALAESDMAEVST